ncbi:hypothetical protein HAX54_004178 [Datura stramonium]|uniref:Uncharacterized protein n=1 Tax=Datura stramonium TaxID=4076 RepID=A0ABS8T6J2_DATST|nr:hypothetical protein [Datura stramonium]
MSHRTDQSVENHQSMQHIPNDVTDESVYPVLHSFPTWNTHHTLEPEQVVDTPTSTTPPKPATTDYHPTSPLVSSPRRTSRHHVVLGYLREYSYTLPNLQPFEATTSVDKVTTSTSNNLARPENPYALESPY